MKKTIMNRFKESDIKTSELANYLQISRPTLYKYFELYDNKKYFEINAKSLQLFKFVDSHPLAGKTVIIAYIINELSDISDEVEEKTPKQEFINLIRNNDLFDDVIKYLLKVSKVINKAKKTKEEDRLLEPYNSIIELNKEEK